MIAINPNSELAKNAQSLGARGAFSAETNRDFLGEAKADGVSIVSTGKQIEAPTQEHLDIAARQLRRWGQNGQANTTDLTVGLNAVKPVDGLNIAHGGSVGRMDNDGDVLKEAERQLSAETKGIDASPAAKL